jgi:hypothetical protein
MDLQHTSESEYHDEAAVSGWTLAGAVAGFSPSAVLSLLNLQHVRGDFRLENHGIVAHIYVDAGEVVDAVLGRDRGLAALFYALSWTSGRFFFIPGPVPPRTIRLSLPVIQVRAALWMERWQLLDRVFPSIWYRVGLHPQPPGEVTIQPHQWQVLTRIVAEPVSIVRLAALLNQDVMAMARIAAELVNMGMAVVLPPDEDEASAANGEE